MSAVRFGVRAKLALTYAATAVGTALIIIALGLLTLRFIPEGDITVVGPDGTATWVPDRTDLLDVFLPRAAIALLAVTVVAVVGGWLLAGWMLRPLDRITQVARSARDGALEQRVRLGGQRDELGELAEVLDAMLDRLERQLGEQQRFAANASHELRTPLAITRTMLEVARAQPPGALDVPALLARLEHTNDRAIELTQALLALVAVERAELDRTSVDLAELVPEAVRDVQAGLPEGAPQVDVRTDLQPATVLGDRTLLRQLVTNLVANAVIHNLPADGMLHVTTRNAGGVTAVLRVENTGTLLDAAQVGTLVEPFQRGAGRTTGPGRPPGAGLGLTIADTITRSHRGELQLTARPGGGLIVRALLPR